jgi:hypothetical protein
MKTLSREETKRKGKTLTEEIISLIGLRKRTPKNCPSLRKDVLKAQESRLNSYKVETKEGGYTASYSKRKNAIILRRDSWSKATDFSRKKTTIHELLHLLGQKHDNEILYSHYLDYFSFYLYSLLYPLEFKNIWKRKMKESREIMRFLQKANKFNKRYFHRQNKDLQNINNVLSEGDSGGAKSDLLIIREYYEVLSEIFNAFGFTPKREMPKISLKDGGWAVCYYNNNEVSIRRNTWKKISMAQKRLFILRKIPLYFVKGRRDALMPFSNPINLFCLFTLLFGKDRHHKTLLYKLNGAIVSLFGEYPYFLLYFFPKVKKIITLAHKKIEGKKKN